MELAVLVTIFLAIAAALGNLHREVSQLNAKVDILWEAYKEEARRNTTRRGTMSRSSQWRLTEQGKGVISPELRKEIRELVGNRKLNPRKLKTWDVIAKLGGVARLSQEAEKVDMPLGEFIVLVETYIQHHLGED